MKAHGVLMGTLALAALALAPACSNTAQGMKEDSRQAAQDLKGGALDAADSVGEAAKDAGGDAAEGATDVGRTIAEAARDIGSEVGAEKQAIDVRVALRADQSIETSHIDVDGAAGSKSVTLRGTVPTTAQRLAAARVAREHAEGYEIRNLLTVAHEE